MALSLQALQQLGGEEARTFVHGVISVLCEKQGTSYEQFSKTLSLSDYSTLKRTIGDTVSRVARQGIDKKKIYEQLVSEGESEEVAGVIAECLWVRRDEVKAQLARNSCSISHSVLQDYDWRTKLVLSSDKLGSVQEPLLSLDLEIMEDNKKRLESVELSKEELAKLISSLEAANKAVLQLRT